MAWHERGLTVATSVLSGLIVAAVVKVANSGVATGVVLLWFALASVGAGLVAWAVNSLLRRRKRSARAFLMTCAFSQKYFLADLVQRLHKAHDHEGVELVLKIPDRDYDAAAQSRHLDRIAARRREYFGGIVIPTELDKLRDILTAFCRDTGLPVVFTDIEPFGREQDYPENAAYVGYDTGELGARAGKWLVKQLRDVEHPEVLVIASVEHDARQRNFVRELKHRWPDVNHTVDDQCAFSRSRAYGAIRAHLRRLGSTRHLDAVFCTNDEMALGVVDALTPSDATRNTVVIGIDGVLEARMLIDSGESPLRATVVQDAPRLAGNIVDVLEKMRRGEKVSTRTILPADIYEA